MTANSLRHPHISISMISRGRMQPHQHSSQPIYCHVPHMSFSCGTTPMWLVVLCFIFPHRALSVITYWCWIFLRRGQAYSKRWEVGARQEDHSMGRCIPSVCL